MNLLLGIVIGMAICAIRRTRTVGDAMTISQSIIDRLLKDQSGCCWKCGNDLYRTGFEVHHAVYTRDVRFSKWLDQIENLLLICPRCHSNHGILGNIETRRKAFKWKVEHGYLMKEWEMSIPFVVHDIFEEVDKNE